MIGCPKPNHKNFESATIFFRYSNIDLFGWKNGNGTPGIYIYGCAYYPFIHSCVRTELGYKMLPLQFNDPIAYNGMERCVKK